ncbi:cytochrome b/b6 domain-containing protein [Aestuariibacter sp. AA17]|uniref:Cytochrome b/b6 domain-containing protein n=1 Tax=Fluctibacter corallii TaxID=2984329 RepID=A0ABT3AB92_9ALTE|nr:cytochrome b/b6 domain-containing protein [Aestuariibacter sp. AA17]MCV2885951.1 cytochrome b/b6 domain-containing protein [Aestuariibacter sp. AA17]
MDVKQRLVWDLPTRLFHWGLVCALGFQWLSAEILEDSIELHAYVGYGILTLLLFRILWGILGTRYARFSEFVAGPKRTMSYLKGIKNGNPPESIGHNPLGAWMIIATLLIVLTQAVSGLFLTDDVLFTAPYYYVEAPELKSWMATLHNTLFNVILGISAVHILAIVLYKFKFKKDLVKPMIHGKKSVPEQHGISSSRMVLAVVLLATVAAFVWWLVFVNPPPIVDDFYY